MATIGVQVAQLLVAVLGMAWLLGLVFRRAEGAKAALVPVMELVLGPVVESVVLVRLSAGLARVAPCRAPPGGVARRLLLAARRQRLDCF